MCASRLRLSVIVGLGGMPDQLGSLESAVVRTTPDTPNTWLSTVPHSCVQERVQLQPPGSDEWFEFDKGMPVGPGAAALAFPQPQVRFCYFKHYQGVTRDPAAAVCVVPFRSRGARARTFLVSAHETHLQSLCWGPCTNLTVPSNSPVHCVQPAVPAVPREQPLGVQVRRISHRMLHIESAMSVGASACGVGCSCIARTDLRPRALRSAFSTARPQHACAPLRLPSPSFTGQGPAAEAHPRVCAALVSK